MTFLFVASLTVISCSDDVAVSDDDGGDDGSDFIGAVYAMTNGEGQVDGVVQGPNTIVTYGRNADGSLTPIGPVLTGGNGGDFDGGEGLDPLISAYAITKTRDNAFVLAVKAGSNTISALPVNDDFSLGDPVSVGTSAEGPNSIDSYPSEADGVNSLVTHLTQKTA